MRPIAKVHGVSVTNTALAWLLHQAAVASVIIGAKNIDRLEDDPKAVDIELRSDALRRLNEVSALPPEYPRWVISRQANGRRPAESTNFEKAK